MLTPSSENLLLPRSGHNRGRVYMHQSVLRRHYIIDKIWYTFSMFQQNILRKKWDAFYQLLSQKIRKLFLRSLRFHGWLATGSENHLARLLLAMKAVKTCQFFLTLDFLDSCIRYRSYCSMAYIKFGTDFTSFITFAWKRKRYVYIHVEKTV